MKATGHLLYGTCDLAPQSALRNEWLIRLHVVDQHAAATFWE